MENSTAKRLAVLGSTGSIGQQALDVVRAFPERFTVVALAGGQNTDLLARQILEFKPRLVYASSTGSLPGEARLVSMEEMASHPDVDLVLVATTGKAGLAPTLAAIRTGKKIALANKEILAMAGSIVMAETRRSGAQILPVDSEHSAIWQCLQGETARIARLILTASGGPFYRRSPSQLARVTVEETLRHPTWKMGPKVTVDSATLMNKGLEAIEAHWLFSVPLNRIEIVIHTQSIVHSLVEFEDSSVKAQLSLPDMHLPIQYALSYPDRLAGHWQPGLDLARIKSLTFEPANYADFPCLELALQAGARGGTYPAVLCAADEVATRLFLTGRVSFPTIAQIVARVLNLHHGPVTDPTLDEILAADSWAREEALQLAGTKSLC